VAPKRKKPSAKSGKGGSLAEKAKNSRFFLAELKEVYKKGQAAFLSSGSRPGVTQAQWAMARVNSYMSGKGGARKADAAIYAKYNKKR
jgi:hypothetical protein